MSAFDIILNHHKLMEIQMRFLILLLIIGGVLLDSCCNCGKNNQSKYLENITQPKEQAIKLEPFVQETDSVLIFGMNAERKHDVDDEYLPTSENFRVEIMAPNGKTFWNSSHDKAFLQVISEVEPVQKGDTERYTMPWNGKTNAGKTLPEGEYKLRMTIPAKPNPYFVESKFLWKKSHE